MAKTSVLKMTFSLCNMNTVWTAVRSLFSTTLIWLFVIFFGGLFLGTLTYVNHLRMLQEDLNANIWAETAIIPASNAGTGHENAKNWLIQCMENRANFTMKMILTCNLLKKEWCIFQQKRSEVHTIIRMNLRHRTDWTVSRWAGWWTCEWNGWGSRRRPW